jgi:uncharacterized protein (DUF1800 family)
VGTDLPNGGVIDIDAQAPELDLRLVRQYRNWWVRRMRADEAGLHEKMTWFWHTHFTTSTLKVPDNNLCWRQLRTLHEHALGNFGDLAKAMNVDGAMLMYLDGDGSKGAAPNENYGRELMELFTLGIGNYRQSDVRSAAKILAGWKVHLNPTALPTALAVTREPDSTYDGRVTIFGRRGKFTPDDLIDIILEQPSCAPFIVRKLWRSFIGGRPDEKLVARWAKSFRRSNFEIAPLVSTILTSEAFAEARLRRARTALEWHCAAIRITGVDVPFAYGLDDLGQMPYMPPSPAGWPGDSEWLSATQSHARAQFLSLFAFDAMGEVAGEADIVDALLDRCSLFELDAGTRSALDDLAAELAADPAVDPELRAATVTTAILLSPDFALA